MEAMQFSGTEISQFEDNHHDENIDDCDLTSNQYNPTQVDDGL